MSTVTDYLNALVAQKNALAAQLAAKGQTAAKTEKLNTLVPKVANLQPADYKRSVNYYIRSLSFTGTYASSTYFSSADCSCARDGAGRTMLIMKSGTSTSYENLYFTLTDSSGLGVTLKGQSVYNYASAASGSFYCAVLLGITAPVNITVNLSSVNSTYDYVTCQITVTRAA